MGGATWEMGGGWEVGVGSGEVEEEGGRHDHNNKTLLRKCQPFG